MPHCSEYSYYQKHENTNCCPEHFIPMEMAEAYIIAKNYSMAMGWFEKAYENHDANIPYIGSTWWEIEPFKIDDPRFYELLNKLNLPLQTSD